MRKFRVNRKTWRTGGRNYDDSQGRTALRNEQGYMCCLGFFCNQLARVPQAQLVGQGSPEELERVVKDLTVYNAEDGRYVDTDLTGDAMELNDDFYLTNQEREVKLAELFKTADIEVEFYGAYPDA